MLGRTNTGGGGGLNFKVVGGTTAPSNPKENMIWVNTSTKITSYIFSATQPTGSAGMVWISTGTSSTAEFNALKKNGIQVYPLSAKQYISGAWVGETAKIYQGGEWVDWVVLIDVTKPDKIETYYGATYTIGEDSVTVKHSKTNGSSAYFAYKANLTNVKKVRVHFTQRQHGSVVYDTAYESRSGVGILSADKTSGNMQFWNGAFLASTINSIDGAAYLDVMVDTLSGDNYIWVGCYGVSNDSSTLAFDSIVLVY